MNTQEKKPKNVNLILSDLKSILKITNDKDLAELLGIKPTTLSNWRTRENIDYNAIFTICGLHNIDVNSLIFDNNVLLVNNSQSNNVEIPVYQDIQVAAGSGLYNHEPQQADSLITLPNYLLKRNTSHICLRVRGDSMAPTIQDCSYVIARLVDKGDYIQINDEHVFVVVFDGKSYIKRVKNRINQGFIVLCSDNLDKINYPNFNVDVNEIQHLWYVVWYISARLPNINDQYYARLQRLEDKLEHIEQRLLP